MLSNWRKSSRSSLANCVEVSGDANGVYVRDTKDNGNGPVLTFTHDEWVAFVGGMADGEFTLDKVTSALV